MLRAHPAFVIAKDHIHNPMATVFDRPVLAHDGTKLLGGQLRRGSVEAGFLGGFVACPAVTVSYDDDPQARPSKVLGKTVQSVDQGCWHGHNAGTVVLTRRRWSIFALHGID